MADSAETIDPEAADAVAEKTEEASETNAADKAEAIKKAGEGKPIDMDAVDAAVDGGSEKGLTDGEKELVEKLKTSKQGVLDKISEAYGIDPKLTTDNFEERIDEEFKNKKSKLARSFKNFRELLIDKFGSNGEKLEKAQEDAEKNGDADKSENFERIKKNWASILKLGAGALAAYELLKAMSEADSGCFVSDTSDGSITKLSCTGSKGKTADACNCVTLDDKNMPAKLGNQCVINDKQPCPGFQYMYRKVSPWDEFGRVGADIFKAVEDGGGALNSIVDFIKKYGLYFAIGIAILVVIGLITAIVKKL